MGLLRLAVLGAPEVFHEGSRLTFALRKAQALLLYLAVEGGMHSRSKLAAFLWPDSEPHAARTGLRTALTLLRALFADSDATSSHHSHLLNEHELLGLNSHAPLELDLDVVQQAYQALRLSAVQTEQQRAALLALFQHALAQVRGPFLDGFWLREETGFDAWVQQQQHQWQVCVLQLFDRLSSWQEEAFELEQARATLTRWLALDPLSEEASRRLMRVHLARSDAVAALQVYATLRARLAEELQAKPSADSVALAEHVHATLADSRGSRPARSSPTMVESRPPGELVAPLVGRAAAFTQLVGSFQQAQQGRPQAALVEGEAGIGKTRLAHDFGIWARAQGADVLSGQAFEMGGRLPYQPLVEAVRQRLEEENAPEDLLDDLWLAELSRLVPELRVRYPDLPAPTEDELAAKLRLFEAVARLMDALAQQAPLVLLLDDLQWIDEASLDLLRYLGRHWKGHSSRVLLLGTIRSEGRELNPQLSADLSDLGRDLQVTRIALQTLSQAETVQLLQAIAGEAKPGTSSGGEQREHGATVPAAPGAEPSPAWETRLSALGDFLFVHTGGQPLYLLETLKLFRDRQWLVPCLSADGTWGLEPTGEMAAALVQEGSRRALVPISVRAMILARLARLKPPTRQLVQASAVLGNQATTKLLWQLAEVGMQAGVEGLEEAVGSGLLREEEAGVGRPSSYRFSHDLIRDVVYTELGAARRQVLHQRVLALLRKEGVAAAELAYHARASGEAEAAYRYSMQAGDEALAVFAVEDAIGHYHQARTLLQEQRLMQTMPGALEIAHLYVSLGQSYAFLNTWGKAQEAYEELVAYAQQKPLPALVSMTLNRLAILALQQSHDKPKVRVLLEEAWRMAETSHDQKALAETECNLAQIAGVVWEDPKSAFPHGQHALSLARGIHDKELEARSLFLLGWIHLRGGNFEEAMRCLEASLALYAALGNEETASQELSIAHFLMGSPLTQPLTNRASEALCWANLAIAQVHAGKVHDSLRSGRRAVALAQAIKNVWVQVISTNNLTQGLLEAGAYEEALLLTQQTVTLARTLPPAMSFQVFLTALGSTYQALQQWEEARSTLAEAEAVAETLDLGPLRVPALSRLCMHYALVGEWKAAYHYAVKAITVRKSSDVALLVLDFSRQYEMEALLRGGDERLAREEVHRLGERLGPYRRFRIPYLRSEALLAVWDGQREQAIDHLTEAAQLAADLGLPAECWQIQAALGRLYQVVGEPTQAQAAFGEAATIIGGLAEGIGDEALRTNFLAGPQIQPVLQQVQREASQAPKDHI
ncbi:MAG: tetratricopeptide repeat protein [Chloroflexi bacterium]|nr:MAG: tetratricopeptide repeat protein [Chloroflexota bacterium]